MNKTQTTIAIDSESKQFLDILYHDYIENEFDYEGNQFCLTTCDGWDENLKAKNFRTLTFKNKDKKFYASIDDILEKIKKYSTQDIWIQICLNNGDSRTNDNATLAPCFWLELDEKNFKNKADLKKACFAIDQIQPGMVTNSGNGVHVFFPFNKLYPLTEKNRDNFDLYNTRLRLIIEKTIKHYLKKDEKLDSIQDRARVLRMPGTLNCKDPNNKKPVRIIHTDETIGYDFDTLCELIDGFCAELGIKDQPSSPINGKTKVTPRTKLNGSGTEYPDETKLFKELMKSLDFHDGLKVSPELLDVMDTRFYDSVHEDTEELKPGFLKTFNGQKKFKGKNTPSERDFSLCSYAKIHGLTPQEALALMIHSRVVNKNDLHLKNKQKYARTIANIYTDIGISLGKLPVCSLKKIKKYFDEGEDGDADLFYELNKGKFLRDNKHTRGNKNNKWSNWNGAYWKEDDHEFKNAVSLLIPEYENYLFSSIRDRKKLDKTKDVEKTKALDELIKSINKRIKLLKTSARKKLIIENVIIRHAKILNTDWDNNPYKLPFLNGVYDLTTDTFNQSKPENLNQMAIPYNYDPKAKCPNFHRIIEGQFGEEAAKQLNCDKELTPEEKEEVKAVKDYFQRLNGLCLPGVNESHSLVVNWGPDGRNGKSYFYESIGNALGDYSSPMRKQTVMKTRGPQGGGVTYCRFVSTSEKAYRLCQ